MKERLSGRYLICQFCCLTNTSAGAMKPQEADCDFCIQYVVDKVNLRNPKKSEPYSVALVDFHDNCGLSVIVGYEDKDFWK